jgi:hypothetical protein
MAVDKGGAGPYSGYKKNYAPIKSSKGTKAEKVVGKVLAAAGGGMKPQKVKVAGRTMTTKPTEAGLGIVGQLSRAGARAASKAAFATTRSPETFLKRVKDASVKKTPSALEKERAKSTTRANPGFVSSVTKLNTRGVTKRRVGSIGKAEAKADDKVYTSKKNAREVARSGKLYGATVKSGGSTGAQVKRVIAQTPSNSPRQTKVPAKIKSSRPKGKK